VVFVTEIIVLSVGFNVCVNTYLKHMLCLGQPVSWLGWLVTASQLGSPGFFLGKSMWDMWWIKWYWDRFLSQYVHYPISVSFLQCSILIIILIQLKRGQCVWGFNPSNIVIHSWILRNIGEKCTFTLFFVLKRTKLWYCGQGSVYLNIMEEDSISVLG